LKKAVSVRLHNQFFLYLIVRPIGALCLANLDAEMRLCYSTSILPPLSFYEPLCFCAQVCTCFFKEERIHCCNKEE
jgi:hypothetical protein